MSRGGVWPKRVHRIKEGTEGVMSEMPDAKAVRLRGGSTLKRTKKLG